MDENEHLELKRGEYETAIHASNILRAALREQIPKDVIVKIEFKVLDSQKRMDIVLCGEKNSQIVVGILEFKQWSKIVFDKKSKEFQANKYRDKIESFEFDSDGCPSRQLSEYRQLIETHMSQVEIQTALVLPNLDEDDGKEFITRVKEEDVHQIYSLRTLDKAAKEIAGWFDAGCESEKVKILTSQDKVAANRIPEFVNNIEFNKLSQVADPIDNERHGWVGSVRKFIRHCEENTLATQEVNTKSTAEKRAIMFSCNFLAIELRKLVHSHQPLMDSVCVVVEFGMILSAHRIDAVLAVCEDANPDSMQLLAIEIKAWSNEEMNKENRMKFISSRELNDSESDAPKRQDPAIIEYTVGGGNPRKSLHPVEQVRRYMQELETEYAEGVGGCAWLHNVPNKLTGIMRDLVKKNNVLTWMQGSNYKTIFESHRGEIIPLITRNWKYEGVNSNEQNNLSGYIANWLPDEFEPFSDEAMKRICDENPKMTRYCINQAFDYAEHILDKKVGPLDDDQRKIAKRIIEAYHTIIDNPGSKTVFSIEGDAGTGKTFIALAVIGKILKMLQKVGGEIRLKQLPRLVCCNNPASDAIAQNCRMDAGEDPKEINPSFMINRQNFNGNSQYFLANALESIYDETSPPPILIFDESQLLAEYTDAQMVALGQHNAKTEFLKWLEDNKWRSHSSERKNLKSDVSVLTMLSPITVFFADPKQATRVKAINNITRKNLKSHCANVGYEYIEMDLNRSYRSEDAYLAMLRDILYSEPSGKAPPQAQKKFTLGLVDTEKEFVKKFNSRMAESTSCGMVAGYTREWKSNGAKTAHELENEEVDWTIGSEEFHWNLSPGRTWIFSAEERRTQIGYYLAIQGNELDELFIYIGEDLIWDGEKDTAMAQIDRHQPKSECRKFSGASDDDIKHCIINQYWVLLTRAKKSCTVYCVDDRLRDIFKKKSLEYGYSS